MGFGVWGLEFGGLGLGCGVWELGVGVCFVFLKLSVSDLTFRVYRVEACRI